MSQGLLDGMYWVSQMLGGTGFIISGLLYMLETQPKWFLQAWDVLGWSVLVAVISQSTAIGDRYS